MASGSKLMMTHFVFVFSVLIFFSILIEFYTTGNNKMSGMSNFSEGVIRRHKKKS